MIFGIEIIKHLRYIATVNHITDRLAHTNELFKELYILKFPEFVQYKTAILMFHLFHGTLPIHLQNRFTVHSTTRSTRCVNTFVMVQARTNVKAMCLSASGVKLWNSLTNNLRDCNSEIIFKKKSEEILYFKLLVSVLVYSATIPCFHMFATLQ